MAWLVAIYQNSRYKSRVEFKYTYYKITVREDFAIAYLLNKSLVINQAFIEVC